MNTIILEKEKISESIAILIKNKRARLNMTQKELADTIGLPKTGDRTIRRWENNECKPSPKYRRKIEYNQYKRDIVNIIQRLYKYNGIFERKKFIDDIRYAFKLEI